MGTFTTTQEVLLSLKIICTENVIKKEQRGKKKEKRIESMEDGRRKEMIKNNEKEERNKERDRWID